MYLKNFLQIQPKKNIHQFLRYLRKSWFFQPLDDPTVRSSIQECDMPDNAESSVLGLHMGTTDPKILFNELSFHKNTKTFNLQLVFCSKQYNLTQNFAPNLASTKGQHRIFAQVQLHQSVHYLGASKGDIQDEKQATDQCPIPR